MNPDEILGQLDFEKLLETYDGAANKLLAVARQDGHFDDAGAGDLVWPASAGIDLAGRQRRVELITRIYDGIPPRRAARLTEAHDRYRATLDPYRDASLAFLQVCRQFVTSGAGSEPRWKRTLESASG